MGAIAFQKDLGAVHSCAHALSTVADLHHGLANGIMIDHVMRFNLPSATAKLAELARVAGVAGAAAAHRGGRGRGVHRLAGAAEERPGHPGARSAASRARGRSPRADIPALVDVAIHDTCHQTNPRKCDARGLRADLRRGALTLRAGMRCDARRRTGPHTMEAFRLPPAPSVAHAQDRHLRLLLPRRPAATDLQGHDAAVHRAERRPLADAARRARVHGALARGQHPAPRQQGHGRRLRRRARRPGAHGRCRRLPGDLRRDAAATRVERRSHPRRLRDRAARGVRRPAQAGARASAAARR